MIAASKAKVAPGKLLINGQWSEGSGKPFDSINPATGEVLTQIADASVAPSQSLSWIASAAMSISSPA